MALLIDPPLVANPRNALRMEFHDFEEFRAWVAREEGMWSALDRGLQHPYDQWAQELIQPIRQLAAMANEYLTLVGANPPLELFPLDLSRNACLTRG